MWKIVGVSVVVRERFKAKLLKVYLVLYAYAQWKGFVLSVPFLFHGQVDFIVRFVML